MNLAFYKYTKSRHFAIPLRHLLESCFLVMLVCIGSLCALSFTVCSCFVNFSQAHHFGRFSVHDLYPKNDMFQVSSQCY